MTDQRLYEPLAAAFAAEGVDTHFTLMGDGNIFGMSRRRCPILQSGTEEATEIYPLWPVVELMLWRASVGKRRPPGYIEPSIPTRVSRTE